MCIGEDHALRCEPVDVGRGDFSALGIEGVDVAITQVVAEDAVRADGAHGKLVAGDPEIVGGSLGGGVVCAAATVMRNGPTVALPTPSVTPISISFVTPTSASPGVPSSSPVAVLNVAQAGLLAMENVSAALGAPETAGT